MDLLVERTFNVNIFDMDKDKRVGWFMLYSVFKCCWILYEETILKIGLSTLKEIKIEFSFCNIMIREQWTII